MDTIDHEIAYYKANRLEFIKTYPGKFLVIKGMQVAAVYASHTDAREYADREHGAGTYIIEHPVDLSVKKK